MISSAEGTIHFVERPIDVWFAFSRLITYCLLPNNTTITTDEGKLCLSGKARRL